MQNGNNMIVFFDVCVGGKEIDAVDDIIHPTEEKPLWLIMRNGRVIACASKGAKVEYRKEDIYRLITPIE